MNFFFLSSELSFYIFPLRQVYIKSIPRIIFVRAHLKEGSRALCYGSCLRKPYSCQCEISLLLSLLPVQDTTEPTRVL